MMRKEGKEALAQYIIRNTFSLGKITYHDETGTVIYRSQMSHGKNKKNFQIYTAEEFIAAITQHIPEKSFQMVRYYGWYSNKSRRLRKNQGIAMTGDNSQEKPEDHVKIIDISEYKPRRIPSKQWRECSLMNPVCRQIEHLARRFSIPIHNFWLYHKGENSRHRR